ncbi:hypothetical protein [Micromonospora sp. NPDC049679]|uniref:hypothetical protein n=1 Tax=Micromonospora sp. NPDC049679 TaxID=3155920 RepID=UPI0033FF4603
MGQQRSGYAMSAIRRLGRIRTPRGRTLLGGVLLGGAMVVALLLAGVVGVPVVAAERPLGRWSTPPPAPLTARQPELTGALLTSVDLPNGYVTRRPADPSPTPRATPSPTGRSATPRPERGELEPGGRGPDCRELFERPWDVATPGARPIDRAAIDLSEERRGALLRQAVSVFSGGGAKAAVTRLREFSGRCRQFDARLGDGTRVAVQTRELSIRKVGDDAYALLLTARSGQRTYTGFIAVGRVGPLVTVLRHVGPAGSVTSSDAAAMLRRSIEKAGPFARDRD